LTSYADIFATKVQFPPPRPFSHSIPLIPGPRLFFIKPYRYTPSLKNEIEHQVQEMLDAGLIQHSTSLFSSPMILVKKKDNTFRFYVDTCITMHNSKGCHNSKGTVSSVNNR
jgi:hypothetical protein